MHRPAGSDFYPPPEYLRLIEAAVNDQRALVAILLGGDAGLRCGRSSRWGGPGWNLAGHSSVAITDRYMHLAPKGTGSAIDLLAGLHAM